MGAPTIRTTPQTERALCASIVACRPQKSAGVGKFKPRCERCNLVFSAAALKDRARRRRISHQKQERRRKPWKAFRGEACERCGFKPEHECQLDVDHIDGDKANGARSNIQTLCANCHRLKTLTSGDARPKQFRA